MSRAREWKGPSKCNTMISMDCRVPIFLGAGWPLTRIPSRPDRRLLLIWSYAQSSWSASRKLNKLVHALHGNRGGVARRNGSPAHRPGIYLAPVWRWSTPYTSPHGGGAVRHFFLLPRDSKKNRLVFSPGLLPFVSNTVWGRCGEIFWGLIPPIVSIPPCQDGCTKESSSSCRAYLCVGLRLTARV